MNHIRHRPAWRRAAPVTVAFGSLLALSFLIGCASQGGTQTAVAQVEVALTAAEKAATLYVSLPQCNAAHAKPFCSEATLNDKIKAADTVAFNAVMAARAGGDSATVASANAAIATLVSLIPAATGH